MKLSMNLKSGSRQKSTAARNFLTVFEMNPIVSFFPRSLLARFFFLALLGCFSGCSNQGVSAQRAGEQFDFESRELTITRQDGSSVTIEAEIARTDTQRERGLMFRKELAGGKGMLFIFERDQIMSFWMKNTLIPLSIAFIASDGRIMELKDMQAESMRTINSSRSVRYALEVPQGWFSRAGIAAGDRVDLGGI
jgi:uncharacterized membrane protein (UPF0127 family)